MAKSVLILVLIAIGLGFYFIIQNFEQPGNKTTDSAILGNTEIKVELADTHEKRVKGLSGREKLDENDGLLFIYDQPDFHGIWMKDMKFPIDIIWFSPDKKVVSIKENARPESFPEIFRPEKPAQYVLEVNAGFVRQNGIKIGDVLKFQ